METLTTSYTDYLDGGATSVKSWNTYAKAVTAALKLSKLFDGDAGGDASWSWLPLPWCQTLSEANDALAEWDKLRTKATTHGSSSQVQDRSFGASGGVGFAAQVQRVEEFRLMCKQNLKTAAIAVIAVNRMKGALKEGEEEGGKEGGNEGEEDGGINLGRSSSPASSPALSRSSSLLRLPLRPSPPAPSPRRASLRRTRSNEVL